MNMGDAAVMAVRHTEKGVDVNEVVGRVVLNSLWRKLTGGRPAALSDAPPTREVSTQGKRVRLQPHLAPDLHTYEVKSKSRQYCGPRRCLMELLHARCAGLDVHKKTVVVCVLLTQPDGRVQRTVSTFGMMMYTAG